MKFARKKENVGNFYTVWKTLQFFLLHSLILHDNLDGTNPALFFL
jgi:hypothetical protein